MTTEVYKTRREKLKKILTEKSVGKPFICALFSGTSPNLERYIADSNFFYLTGTEIQGASYVVIFDGKNYSEVLFLPPPNPIKARWEVVELSSGHLDKYGNADDERKKAIEETGFETILPNYEILDYLSKPLNFVRDFYLDFSFPSTFGSISALKFWDEINKIMPNIQVRNLREIITKLRTKKDIFEIAKIRKAVDIAIEAQNIIMDIINPGIYEYEVEAAVKYVFVKNFTQGESFASIIASGKNSTILHYNQNKKKILANETVVCDLGVKKDFYCSDLTRTYPSSGKFTKEQRVYYEIVFEAQQIALETIKAGVCISEINKKVAEFYKRKGKDKYNFHGVSHHLGIDVHDGGSIEEPLQENSVITVEPGLYNQNKKIGIRIEDDVIVKKNGIEIISKELIKELSDIEKRLSKPRKKIVI